MSILDSLSSSVGDRTEESNKAVAVECIKSPGLLVDIEIGLLDKNDKLAGDCAEVATCVATENPFLIVPLSQSLFKIIEHKNTRARWEAVHAISLISEYVSEDVANHLSILKKLITIDKSIIVRDYSTDIIANFAKAGKSESEKAYPLLRESLYIYEGRHAGHALVGLKHVASNIPEYKDEITSIAEEFILHKRVVISKAAKSLLKFIKSLK